MKINNNPKQNNVDDKNCKVKEPYFVEYINGFNINKIKAKPIIGEKNTFLVGLTTKESNFNNIILPILITPKINTNENIIDIIGLIIRPSKPF